MDFVITTDMWLQIATALGAFIASIIAVLKHREASTATKTLGVVASAAVSGNTGSCIPDTPVGTDPDWSPSFMVLPAYACGPSPFKANIAVTTTPSGPHEVVKLDIDWEDGTHTSMPVTNGLAAATHEYVYKRERHYTGHTFYPAITITTKDGIVRTYNTHEKGRCCSIWVWDAEVGPRQTDPMG